MRRAHLAAVLVALTLALVACSSGAVAPTGPVNLSQETLKAIGLGADWNWKKQAAPLQLGVTHTQESLDPEEPAQARDRGVAVLKNNGAIWQNVHLMGFGTLNPEPAPGQYDWSTLDQRMKLVKDTGGRTVLTLCCSPDWMKGGAPGETDWSQLETAPEPAHFDDFAALAAQAVQRYPQIERVLVWNELKGFYNSALNRWDYEGYTELYNKVYTAVKAVRPDVQVGGPYVVMTSLDPGSPDSSDVRGPWGVADQRALDVVDYWLANNVGADFIAVDGGTATRNDTVAAPADAAARKFADLTAWIRQRSPLPVWWAEFYPDVPSGEDGGPTSQASAASTLAVLAAYAQSGVSVALLWGPQGADLGFSALWTDSTKSDGGRPTPLTAPWQWLVPRLASGDVSVGHSPNLPMLAFRAPDGLLLVNLTAKPIELTGTESLPPWAVLLSPRVP
ncbi:GH39 family glycosyl hydrolase [Pseudonocardia xinjiangensis]|uniref:Glycosyl hydrolases family 39 N-terminal catalytic domain-containing protein n=1 Tax=Pseudonocardia xinjiangensis TaxID=75289 RepID=A0ABX1RL59_9PSEU|nr:hypothetical protein [Pseudonocardia xinjiangensis]NMH80571.1 hypothetical protein [Pseudonocardia xinjiangensis]